jgi:putative intracellular protease/amidase
MALKKVGFLLFDTFETLDVFGPVEIFGRLKNLYELRFFSLKGGVIRNDHGVAVLSEPLDEILEGTDIFIIPGGYGTRIEVGNSELIDKIRIISDNSEFVHTICTGTALLARTGLLNNRRATSNKRAFEWVNTQGEAVLWQPKARWITDGKFYTSSGVSAGMDMTLAFIAAVHGQDLALEVASEIEYIWNSDAEIDPFFSA